MIFFCRIYFYVFFFLLRLFKCWWEILRNSNKFTKKLMLVLVVLSTMIAVCDGICLPFFAQFNVKSNKQLYSNLSLSLSTSIQAHHCFCFVASHIFNLFQIIFDLNQYLETCESSFMEMCICCCFFLCVVDIKNTLIWMDGWIIFSFFCYV